MPYITPDLLELRLGAAALVQLADDDGDGVADAAVIEETIAAAEGEVDSYLAARYAVPVDLSAYPAAVGVLRGFVLDLAEYRLRARRPPISESAVRRRDEAVAWLRHVAGAAVDLPAVGAPPGQVRGRAAATTGHRRVLSHDELEDF